jgi:hypothetical protein
MNRAPPVPPDANLTVRHPSVAWPIGLSLLALALAAAVFAAKVAKAQPAETEHTLVIHACRQGECKTISFPVPNCTAGGQAWIVAWQANNPMHALRAWKCVDGEVA